MHWAGVEVVLPGGERGVVLSVSGASAQVAVGGLTRSEAAASLALAPPGRKDRIRIVSGELAGQEAELVGTDEGEGIVKIGDGDVKVLPLSVLGRLAAQE